MNFTYHVVLLHGDSCVLPLQVRRYPASDLRTDTRSEFKMASRSNYCSLCAFMVSVEGLERVNSPKGFAHGSKEGCEATAGSGCFVCRLIVNDGSIRWKQDEAIIFFANEYFLMWEVGEDSSTGALPSFDSLAGYVQKGDERIYISTLYIYTRDGDPLSKSIIFRPVELNVASDKILDVVKSWIKDCWGGPQPLVATTHNLESMKSHIILADLPATIQDVIEVTRRLGYRFLWVDALCILQDSELDKSQEIQKMGSIYKNATVTISAAAASGVTEGFLRLNRTPPPSCEFQFPTEEGESTVFISHDYSPSHPLDKRGWALQELLPSSRLLVFSEKELIWHCQSEQFKTVNQNCLYYNDWSARLPLGVFIDSPPGSKSRRTQNEKLRLWKSIVSGYSRRHLTDQDDRLDALAGIANELRQVWKDDYIFGVWKENFVHLLWWLAWDKERTRLQIAPT